MTRPSLADVITETLTEAVQGYADADRWVGILTAALLAALAAREQGLDIALTRSEVFWAIRALEDFTDRDDYWGIDAVASAKAKLKAAHPAAPVSFASIDIQVDELMPTDCIDFLHQSGKRDRFKL